MNSQSRSNDLTIRVSNEVMGTEYEWEAQANYYDDDTLDVSNFSLTIPKDLTEKDQEALDLEDEIKDEVMDFAGQSKNIESFLTQDEIDLVFSCDEDGKCSISFQYKD